MRQQPGISVVVPVRNRSGIRLANCLASLRAQRLSGAPSPETVELIVSDFGSTAPHAENIRVLAETHGATLVRTDTNQVWNRSLVLNVGIRTATGRYVMCTDADMVFQDNFLQSALDTFAAVPDAFVVCRCHDLPAHLADTEWTSADVASVLRQASVRSDGGTGACQIASREVFEALRGYDEGYKYWGSEDKDMLARAKRYGLIVQWLDQHTAMLHQWHPTRREDRWLRVRINRWRYRLTKRFVVKNPRAWGLRP